MEGTFSLKLLKETSRRLLDFSYLKVYTLITLRTKFKNI